MAKITNIKVCKLLIESGANVNARDKRNNTALSYVKTLTWNEGLEIRKLLIKEMVQSAKGEAEKMQAIEAEIMKIKGPMRDELLAYFKSL